MKTRSSPAVSLCARYVVSSPAFAGEPRVRNVSPSAEDGSPVCRFAGREFVTIATQLIPREAPEPAPR